MQNNQVPFTVNNDVVRIVFFKLITILIWQFMNMLKSWNHLSKLKTYVVNWQEYLVCDFNRYFIFHKVRYLYVLTARQATVMWQQSAAFIIRYNTQWLVDDKNRCRDYTNSVSNLTKYYLRYIYFWFIFGYFNVIISQRMQIRQLLH